MDWNQIINKRVFKTVRQTSNAIIYIYDGSKC